MNEYSGVESAYAIGIVSHARSDAVCEKTLAFLVGEGVDMSLVSIFVAPAEVTEYRRALRRHGLRVSVRNGALGLNGNMYACYAYYPSGTHLVIMSDGVCGLQVCEGGARRVCPSGVWGSLVCHAWELMDREGVYMWGLCNGSSYMDEHKISRKFGLVTGSIVGHRVCASRRYLFEHREDGVVWDLEHSLLTWSVDGVFLRYEMLVASYKFGQLGGHSRGMVERRRIEDVAIKRLASRYPRLITYQKKVLLRDAAKSRVQNYRIRAVGAGPLLMPARGYRGKAGVVARVGSGRRRKYFAGRALNEAEKKRVQRVGGSMRQRIAALRR